MTTPAGTVQAINEALDILENALEPLFGTTLQETIENQDTLNQAKLCAMLPYIVDQLITIYLRTRGIDATTHYVHAELERIKVYFHKIARTEDPTTNSMGRISDQTMQLDKDAANRFIKAALAEATRDGEKELKRLGIDGPTNATHTTWQPRQRSVDEQRLQPEGGMHTRFAKLNNDEESDHSTSSSSLSGNELAPINKVSPDEEKKRKRPIVDPFTGYSEPRSKKSKGSRAHKATTKSTGFHISNPGSADITTPESGSPSPQAQSPNPSKNARKKAKKKSRLQGNQKDDKSATTIEQDGE